MKDLEGCPIKSVVYKRQYIRFLSDANDSFRISFPAEATADMSVKVNVPSGMSVLSVSGGEKTIPRSAAMVCSYLWGTASHAQVRVHREPRVSGSGEDFTVTTANPGGNGQVSKLYDR